MTGTNDEARDLDDGDAHDLFAAALAGEMPVPHPLVNQLACCLFVSGYAVDTCEEKAIAAMQSGAFFAGSAAMGDTGGFVAERHRQV